MMTQKCKLLLGVGLTIIAACKSDRSQEVQAEIHMRVERERKVYTEAAEKRLLELAEKQADSILLQEAKLQINDSLRNKQPSKPLPPAELIPLDSGKVEKLF